MSYNELYVCPYCAYEDRLISFRVKAKRGYSRQFKQCPDCLNIMSREILTNEITIKQWAYWLYNATKIGDYYKIKFEKLLTRLYEMRISGEFWSYWREAKTSSLQEMRFTLDKGYYKSPQQELNNGMGVCLDCDFYGLLYTISINKMVCCSCYYKRLQNLITMIIYEKMEIFKASWEWVFVNHIELTMTDSYKSVKSPYW